MSVVLQVIGRLIVGFAVSLSATAECTYIAEISPRVSAKQQSSLSNVLHYARGYVITCVCMFVRLSVG